MCPLPAGATFSGLYHVLPHRPAIQRPVIRSLYICTSSRALAAPSQQPSTDDLTTTRWSLDDELLGVNSPAVDVDERADELPARTRLPRPLVGAQTGLTLGTVDLPFIITVLGRPLGESVEKVGRAGPVILLVRVRVLVCKQRNTTLCAQIESHLSRHRGTRGEANEEWAINKILDVHCA